MERKFIEIFTGLKRDFGIAYFDKSIIDPETGKKKPTYGWADKPITDQDYLDHLNGKKSIGIQPCNDEGKVLFGAIDIDSKDYKDFSVKKYLDIVREYDLPLIPIKSKSGGLHLYLFLKSYAKAQFVRNFLDTLLFTLKLPTKTEIYPKQTELGQDAEGKLSVGQFINLPYFNKNDRVAINFDGKPFTFEQFIQVVEANQKTVDELEEFSLAHVKTVLQGGPSEFDDGPPCLQIMAKEPLTDGRDRWLYNYMVFAKKKYPDNWDKKVIQAAQDYFKRNEQGINDWDEKKVRDKIRSWKKDSTKGHSCTQEPIVSYCMKSECLKRTFGVASDRKRMFPSLTGLQKINYPEPQYTFNVELPGGKVKNIRAKYIGEVNQQQELRSLIMKSADIFVPTVKTFEFEEIINKLFPPKDVINPPKGTTPDEQLEEYLKEYLNGPQAKSHASFKSGAVLIEDEYAYFKWSSFCNLLKNKEFKENKMIVAQKVKDLFKAEFGQLKRFPKKLNEKESHDPIEVVKIPMDKFSKKHIEPEVINIKSKKDIM
jgi:hypothetical protein